MQTANPLPVKVVDFFIYKQQQMIILAIDPGKNGSIAVLNGKNLMLKKMPQTPKEIYDFLKKFSNADCVCYLEKVGGMSNNGGSRAFNFGMNYGFINMALLVTGIKIITVTPQKWQKHFQLGTKASCATGTIWKNKLKAKAEQLFPKQKMFLWGSDATLIGVYAQTLEK